MFRQTVLCAMLAWGIASAGCAVLHRDSGIVDEMVPKEKKKITFPDYIIEAPDILEIDALRVIPKAPYKIDVLDVLEIYPQDVGPDWPISAGTGAIAVARPKLFFTVDPDGTVNLGPTFRTVNVIGLTLEEAKEKIEKLFKRMKLPLAKVSVSLAQSRGMQQIKGEHLVRPNGTITLGVYGDVPVAGLTLDEAKAVIVKKLESYLSKVEIAVDIVGYNSKVYYLIIDLAGAGQQIVRLPTTGNETVLDAIAQVSGLPAFASKKKIWLVRPGASDDEPDRVLPINWKAITLGGSVKTNYQLFPGDRVYVKADPYVVTDSYLAKLISPIERILGITLLGQQTVRDFRSNPTASGQ